MSQHQTSDITQAVLDRLADDADPRFKQIITAVVKHAHALAREVDLTPAEWMNAIQFLTKVGQTCDAKRQEFILLSDTLGISMLVVAMNNAKPPGATEATSASVGAAGMYATLRGVSVAVTSVRGSTAVAPWPSWFGCDASGVSRVLSSWTIFSLTA